MLEGEKQRSAIKSIEFILSEDHEQSSRNVGRKNSLSPNELLNDLDDDGSNSIYHVPSFLLKTYEIVDVSPPTLH